MAGVTALADADRLGESLPKLVAYLASGPDGVQTTPWGCAGGSRRGRRRWHLDPVRRTAIAAGAGGARPLVGGVLRSGHTAHGR